MFKKQKQREDHTFTTCKDVKNENEPHCLNRILSTEVTCNGTCTQHKVKCSNIMNVEIDQPPKNKQCIIESHKRYELKTSTSLESTKDANDMEIRNTVFPRINARGVYFKIRDFRGRSFEGAFIRGRAFISKFQK